MCEASLCGLPIIATNHSGHTMFLNKENSYLVDIDKLEKVREGIMHVHYWDNQLFPALRSPDFINRLRYNMRKVFENEKEANKKNFLLQKELRTNYSFDAASDRYVKRIKEIWSKISEGVTS